MGWQINSTMIRKAEKVLIGNGIKPDEAGIVLQAIGYILLDTELYPDINSNKVEKETGSLYDVTVTRIGGILVYADNKDDAFDKVNSMPAAEIDLNRNLTDWEPSDVQQVAENETPKSDS